MPALCSWCADQSGYIQSGVIPKFSLCSDGVKWFESKGRFRDASYTPAAGDIIFFDWGNNGTIDHVGIVESVSGGTVNTIEGNSGDKVARRSYSIGSSNIYGYGVPAYSEKNVVWNNSGDIYKFKMKRTSERIIKLHLLVQFVSNFSDNCQSFHRFLGVIAGCHAFLADSWNKAFSSD